jgi:hypothetical protein
MTVIAIGYTIETLDKISISAIKAMDNITQFFMNLICKIITF